MKTKTRYRATLPNGEKVTRTSLRSYTHVVAARRSVGGFSDAPDDWGVWSWNGSLALAQKAAKAAAQCYLDVEILPASTTP